jgi:YD repeat-containing protein
MIISGGLAGGFTSRPGNIDPALVDTAHQNRAPRQRRRRQRNSRRSRRAALRGLRLRPHRPRPGRPRAAGLDAPLRLAPPLRRRPARARLDARLRRRRRAPRRPRRPLRTRRARSRRPDRPGRRRRRRPARGAGHAPRRGGGPPPHPRGAGRAVVDGPAHRRRGLGPPRRARPGLPAQPRRHLRRRPRRHRHPRRDQRTLHPRGTPRRHLRLRRLQRLASVTDRSGNAVTLHYGAQGRLAAVSNSFGRALSVGSGGRITSVGDRQRRTHRRLRLRRLRLPHQRATDAAGFAWTASYAPDGALLSQTDPERPPIIRNFYNGLGQVVRQISSAGQPWVFGYAAGTRSWDADPHGRREVRDHDDEGRVVTRLRRDGTQDDYLHDARGRLVRPPRSHLPRQSPRVRRPRPPRPLRPGRQHPRRPRHRLRLRRTSTASSPSPTPSVS